jgi:hypothetical protein
MPRKLFKRYMPDVDKVRQIAIMRMFGDSLFHPALWHLNRRSAAGGVATGLFCGLIPGPLQMLGAGAVAVLFRINLPVRAEMSEALGHLYRAAVSVRGGRGRLLVAGSDPAIHDALTDLLRGTGEAPPGKIDFPALARADLEAWLDRWGVAQPARRAEAQTVRAQAGDILTMAGMERRLWEALGKVGPPVEIHDFVVAELSTRLGLKWRTVDGA